MKIAILGATSHVAKNLIIGLNREHMLYLYARSTERVFEFLKNEFISTDQIEVEAINSFSQSGLFDTVVNCIGFGTPDKVRNGGADILLVTELYDNLIIEYLKKYTGTVYINFSSGALFGPACSTAVDKSSEFRLALGDLSSLDAYRVSKLNAETKHRCLSELSIVDLRLFSFFSRYIEVESSYLVTDMLKALLTGSAFETSELDIVRDYIHPNDLSSAVLLCAKTHGINRSFDLYSKAPVKKSEIISQFIKYFGLQVSWVRKMEAKSPTGIKSYYASNNRDANDILGYEPVYTSMEVLIEESRAILIRDKISR